MHEPDVRDMPDTPTGLVAYGPGRRAVQQSATVQLPRENDLFHQQVPEPFLARVWAEMVFANQHVYQVLTKRHGRMRSLLSSERFRAMVAARWRRRLGLGEIPDHWDWDWDWWPASHIWVGVSVEDQQRADLRVPVLLEVPAKVRFLSCEPLLGPIDLAGHLYPEGCPDGCGYRWPDDPDARDCGCTGPCCTDAWRPDPGIHWVIVGGESGLGARPMDIEWATDLVEQCQGAEVAVFVKQLGAHPWRGDQPWQCRDPKGGDPAEWPADLRVRQYSAEVEAAELPWDERP